MLLFYLYFSHVSFKNLYRNLHQNVACNTFAKVTNFVKIGFFWLNEMITSENKKTLHNFLNQNS